MALIRYFLIAAMFFASCESPKISNSIEMKPSLIAENFAYPISKKEFVTEAKDSKDDWYNATNFGETNHLGEDWNRNSGGNTDCGEPVYAIGNGVIIYTGYSGIGWGNVVIIEHTLPDGKKSNRFMGIYLRFPKHQAT